MSLNQPSPPPGESASAPRQAGTVAIRQDAHRIDALGEYCGDQFPQAPRSPVRLCVWGVTATEQDHAIHKAHQGWGRNCWEFVSTERHMSGICPLDLLDPKSLAAEQGYGWAYVAYRAEPVP